MNTSKKSLFALVLPTLALLLVFLASPLVQAAVSVTDDEEEMNYEDIVKELSKEQRKATAADNSARAATVRKKGPKTSLDDVLIHGGVGFTQMFGTVNFNGDRTHLSQRGIQATLGIDLFSHNWLAEGSARNFTSYDYGNTNVALKEFDLKIVYHKRFAPKLGLRLGSGLAARYMQISNNSGVHNYTTPASVFTGGVELLAARSLTIAAEVSARSALIAETLDKNSYDMTVRLDANF